MRPEIYFTGCMGRKPYSTRNLTKAAAAPTPTVAPASLSPSPGCSTPEWVTKDEMMRRLRMGKRFLEKLMKRRKIPFRKYSRKMVRFNPSAVETALAVYNSEVEA